MSKLFFYQKCHFLQKKPVKNQIFQAFFVKCFCHFIKVLKTNNFTLVLVRYSKSFCRKIICSKSTIFYTFLLLPWQPLRAWVILWQIFNIHYIVTMPAKFELDLTCSLENDDIELDTPLNLFTLIDVIRCWANVGSSH